MRTTPQLDDGALRSGLPQLPVKASGGVVDLELVTQLREEEACWRNGYLLASSRPPVQTGHGETCLPGGCHLD